MLARSVVDDFENLIDVLHESISESDRNVVELMRDGGVEKAIQLRTLIASFGADAGVLVEPRDRVAGTAWPRPETFGACPCSRHLGDRRYRSDIGLTR